MKFDLILVATILILSCGGSESSPVASDSVIITDSVSTFTDLTIDTLQLDYSHNTTNCLNGGCDSFLLIQNLNKDFQITIEQCNLDSSFNTAVISVSGVHFLVDTLLLKHELITPVTVHGIYQLNTGEQQFIYFWLPPKHSYGSGGWKMLSVLVEMVDGKPKFAYAYNNYTEHDPEGASGIGALSVVDGKLRIAIRKDKSSKTEIREPNSGELKLIN